MEAIVNKLQVNLIFKSKKYLSDCRRRGIDISTSPFCDLNTWSNGVGYEKLLLFKKKQNFNINFFWQIFL